jgi:hypothetical protein
MGYQVTPKKITDAQFLGSFSVLSEGVEEECPVGLQKTLNFDSMSVRVLATELVRELV